MRKIIALSLLAVFLFTVPAYATGFKINGKGYSADTINKDGSLYVPVRFISEKMGYTVEFVNGEVRLVKATTRPPIEGDAKFVSTVNQALDLLEQKDPADYLMVCENTEKIWINNDIVPQKANTTRYAESNGKNIAFSKDFLASDYYNSSWVAGVLVHESCHEAWWKILQTNENKNTDETIAHAHHITALELTGAPQKYIDNARNELSKLK